MGYVLSMWDMGYDISIWIHHTDIVILDIDTGYGLMIWEMTVSMWSSPISIWDTLSLWSVPLPSKGSSTVPLSARQGRTFVHFSAQSDPFWFAEPLKPPGESLKKCLR
jgi:hypothetical protein